MLFPVPGQHDWADRLAERGLRERRKLEQPIAFTTLIERLINVAYMRMHPEDRKDVDQAYLWLQRSRDVSGPTEADQYAAAAWRGYFHRRGESAKAAAEAAYFRRVVDDPLNFTSTATMADYAIYFCVASAFALSTLLLLVLSKVLPSALRTPRRASEWFDISLSRRTLVLLVLVQLAVIALCTAAGAPWRGLILVGIVITLLGVPMVRGSNGLREAIASIDPRQRVAVAIMLACFTIATLTLFQTLARVSALAKMPIGAADSLGHPMFVSDLEGQLARESFPELLYVTAVANELDGNTERAKALYSDSRDPRAQEALAALEHGQSSVSCPTSAELAAVYGHHAFSLHTEHEGLDDLGESTVVANVVSRLLILGSLFFVISCFFIRPDETGRTAGAPRRPWARTAAKTLFLVLPGSFDVRRRSALRGVVLLLATGFVLMLAISAVKAFPVLHSPGVVAAIAIPNIQSAAPFPPEISAVDMMFAPPHARWFWGIAFVVLSYLIVTHLRRIPAILALYQDDRADDAPTVVPGTGISGEAL